jgi:pimeloyl-ACP methyl ester carboxylesterase
MTSATVAASGAGPIHPGFAFWRVARAALLACAATAVGLAAMVWLRPLTVIAGVVHTRMWLDGMRGQDVMLEGHRIHYYVGGSGDTIVLVHGLGSRAEDWASLMPALLRSGHRVYAIDLLGYGQSDKPANASYSIPEEAGIVRAFLASQHLEHTALAGWSMGGWIAMRVALDEPERVSRLLLYDSAGLMFKVGFTRDVFVPTTLAQLDVLNKMLNPDPVPHIPGFLARDLLRRVQDDSWVVQRSVNSMMTGADLLDGQLSALDMPVLIVWGKQDRLTPLSVGEEIHREAPDSTLAVIDGCGHLAPEQCAGQVARTTLRFLSESPESNALQARSAGR